MFKREIIIVCVFYMLFAVIIAFSADWTQWRGIDRNDIISESSLSEKWPPKRIWDKNVGKGCTSPIIVDGKIYVMGWYGEGDLNRNPIGTDILYCLDAKTGKELWKQTYKCRYQSRIRIGDEGHYGGPSSTPAYDLKTGYLYTISIDGDLRCWDTSKNGQLIWALNLYDSYNIPQRPDVGRGQRDFGFTSSPLIYEDLVIVEVGSNEGTVMAFDKKTGQRKWASECKEPAGHTSGPVILTVDGMKCLATLTLKKLVVMCIDKGNEGKTIAEYHWQSDYANNIPTPAIIDNMILLTSSWNPKKTALIEVSLNGTVEKWRGKDFSQVCSPIIHKGNIYMVDGQLKCLNLSDGQTKWKGGNFGYGSCLVTKDDKIIAFGNGQLVLAEANPTDNKYTEISSIKDIVPDICYPHIAFSNGIICCKDKSGNMVCFSLN